MLVNLLDHGRVKRTVGTSLAILLLFAVPVSALTFPSGWQIAQKQNNGALASNIIQDFNGVGSLLVDMRNAPPAKGKSTVTAERVFNIGAGGENINIRHQYETFLQNASLNVKIKVISEKGFTVPDANNEDKGPGQTFALNQNFANFFDPGTYTIRIKISYKNKTGQWDNSAPAPGSPHTFEITAL